MIQMDFASYGKYYFKDHTYFVFLFCFELGFQISNPVIEYRHDPSCMSYKEVRAEMPLKNNSQS